MALRDKYTKDQYKSPHSLERMLDGRKYGVEIAKAAKSGAEAVGKGVETVGKGLNALGKHVSSYGSRVGGAYDREWANHNYIARKRNPAGKWVYDYGHGFAKPRQSEINLDISASKAGSRNTGRTKAQKGEYIAKKNIANIKNEIGKVTDAVGGAANAVGGAANDAARAISDGASFLSGVGKGIAESTSLKDISNAVGGAANSVSNAVGGAANSVSNAVGGAANTVSNAVNEEINNWKKIKLPTIIRL